jgi:hypothetical protein
MRYASIRSSVLTILFLSAASLHAANYTVTNTDDSGPGSLRQAILDMNGHSGTGDTIVFAIGSGPQTIRPLSQLPEILHGDIDGRTQPGFSGKPIIELDGSLTDALTSGLFMSTEGIMHSLVVNNFPNYGVAGGQILNCYIGTDITGKFGRGNDIGIGGGRLIEGNLISGNNSMGMIVSSGTSIIGNRIGTDVTGNQVLSATTGLHILGQPNLIEDNVIGGAEGFAILVRYAPLGTTIRNNFIGVSRNGAALPNSYGILLEESAGAPITGNHIANNLIGVVVDEKTIRASILNNRFEKNHQAIQLAGSDSSGPLPNDPGDGDVGGNNLQNYPVLTSASSVGGTSTIQGSLDSAPNRQFTIELYLSPSCNASGYGEGNERLDGFSVTTNAEGMATFTRTLQRSLPLGQVITSTATSTLEGTSEFSKCTVVEGAGRFVFDPSSINVAEGAGGVATVRRTDGAIGAASVQYATANGIAAAGSDYTATNGTLLFADGETSKTVPFQTKADDIYEGPETFTIKLTNATGASLGNPSAATVNITDAQPAPTLTVVGSTGHAEGNSGLTNFKFVLKLSHASALTENVSYETQAGTATPDVDYLPISGTLTFAPGEVEKNVNIQVIGDSVYEPEEDFFFLWSSHGWGGGQEFGIFNDDAPPAVTAENISVRETDGTITATITLKASAPIHGEIFYSTKDGTAVAGEDYVSKTGTVVFSSQEIRTLTLEIKGDNITEGLESFTVKLFTNWDGFSLPTPTVRVDISDDDAGIGPPNIQIPAGQSRSAAIQIGGALPNDVAFQLISDNPAGFTVPATITLPAGSTRTSFDIKALAPPGQEGTITITFPATLGGGTGVVHVSSYIGAELVLTPSNVDLYAGSNASIRASLIPASNAPVTVRLSLLNDNVALPSDELIIPAGGEGTFSIQGTQQGFFTVTATLPSKYGRETSNVRGRVLASTTKPVLVSLSPANGSIAGGTEVDVRGLLLRQDCSVSFGGVEATSLSFASSEQITVTTPPHGAGTVDATLRCGSDVSTLPNAFLYRNAEPTLSAVTPSSGSGLGNTFVRVTGSNFVHSCWPLFGGVRSSVARVLDDRNILAVVPPHAAGTADVSLLCTGSEALLTGGFTYNERPDPAAQIESVEPSFGSPGEVITIRGSHLRLDDSVTFAGIAALILDSTPEAHVVVVPDVPAGPVSIAIDTPAGVTASTTGPVFTVGEPSPPRVVQVAAGAVAAGSEVELEGTMFRAPYLFAFGGKYAQIVTMTPSLAVVRLPRDLAAGSYPATVLNSSAQIASLGPSVTVIAAAPVVSGVSRRCATTDGGLEIIITGTGFAAGATVTFDSVPATDVNFIDAATIRARVPPNAAGPATIAVTNPDHARGTRTNAFRYSSPFDPSPCSDGRGRAARH